MIFREPPKDFKPNFNVVGCYLFCKGEFILLHRRDDKPQGGTWDTAGGKVHHTESIEEAVIREVREETGVAIDAAHIKKVGTFYVIYPDIHFVFHVHRYDFEVRPDIVIRPTEHTDYKWVTPSEALKMELIPDEDYCVKQTFPEYLQ